MKTIFFRNHIFQVEDDAKGYVAADDDGEVRLHQYYPTKDSSGVYRSHGDVTSLGYVTDDSGILIL